MKSQLLIDNGWVNAQGDATFERRHPLSNAVVTEAAAAGIHWTFAPMVDISNDPRWGRVSEGAGEDPFLGSQIAKAMVKGYQGDDLKKDNTILACVKHFPGHGDTDTDSHLALPIIRAHCCRLSWLMPHSSLTICGL